MSEEKILYVEEEEKEVSEMIAETAMKYGFDTKRKYTIEDYYALPDEDRAELIDGVFYDMAAPTTFHQRTGLDIAIELEAYVRKKKGSCKVFMGPVDVQLDCDEWTMVQPDVLVVCERDKVKERNVYGEPDLVVEVLSSSTARKDMTVKLEKYRNAGVREYWMIDIKKEKILVYEFEKGNSPAIYGRDSQIPVGIFGGECVIDFEEIFEEIKEMSGRE